MAIDDSYALWIENAGAVNNARDYRAFLTYLCTQFSDSGGSATGNGGVCRSGDLAVSERGAGANMSVDVARGAAVVLGTVTPAQQGGYFAYNDATVNVAISAADPTNPRYDIVGIRVRDSEYAGGDDDAAIVVVTGTPAASPAEPTLPANFLPLARVEVPASDTAIGNAQIVDRRRRMAALGGIHICTSSTRPSNPWEGYHIYETDTERVLVYDGAAWIRGPWYSATGRTGFSAYIDSGGWADGAWTLITWSTEGYDSDGFSSAGTTITIPSGLGGVYTETLTLTVKDAVTYTGMGTAWRRNGTAVGNTIAGDTWWGSVGAGVGDILTTCTWTGALDAGDVLRGYMYQVSGAQRSFIALCHVYRIGA